MARHLNDETAEFKMPRPGRHAAEDEAGKEAGEEAGNEARDAEATQRFDPGFRERPRPAPPAPPATTDSQQG